MRLTICLLLTMWCWRALGQEETEPELMRLSRRPSHSNHIESPGYKASVVHTDPNSDRKHSISTVTLQLHLKGNKLPIPETEEDYVSAPSQDDYSIMPKRLSEPNQHDNRQQQQSLRQQRHHEYQQKMREQIEEQREQEMEENRKQQKQEVQRQKHHRKSNKNSNAHKENSITQDSDTGASNEHASARYVLPPDGFINNGQIQQNVRYVGNQQQVVQYASTPTPQVQYASSPAPPVNPNQNQQQQFASYPSGASSNAQYFTTPAPVHFASTQSPRMQFLSSPTDYRQQPSSQVHYMSTPAPNVQYEPNFGSNSQASNNNVQYASTPLPRMQYMSTPSPPMQFVSQISQQHHQSQGGSQMQFVSTPLPNVQHVSTQSPQGQYVSSPAHVFSTPSPQHSTNAPLYGSRLNTLSQVNYNNSPQKQMHIHHFDNAMSGVRSPKYSPQFSGSLYISSTPSPVQVSTVSTPISQIQNEDQWKAGINPNTQNINNQQIQNFQSNSNFQNQQLHNQHLYQTNQINQQQEQQLNQNTIESANNRVVNIVQQNQNSRSIRQEAPKVTQQRDLEKETNNYSNGDFGWKLAPKKSGNEQNGVNDNLQSAASYPSSTLHSSSFGSQSLPQQPNSFEYKPYPENPFLNHISYQTASPPQKTGSIQSISFSPDNNQQQNINVGYSIGFGGSLNTNQETTKIDSSVYANKYPFIDNVPGFTPSSINLGNLQSDVIKGVHLSQVNVPDSSFFLKDSSNPQDYVTNALKDHEKMKQSNNIRFGSNNQINNFNGPPSPYKISQTFKASDNENIYENNFHGTSFSNSPKALSLQGNSPNVITSYHGTEVRNDAKNQGYKWNNVGPGVEISSPSHLNSDFRELVTPNPVVYMNNLNDVVTNSPFFYSSQRETGDGRVMRGFDHANALKNIQPIGLSNVVSYSPAPLGDAGVPVTMSPLYINSATSQQSYAAHINPIPSGHFIQNFPQDQINMSPSSMNSPNIIEQSLANFYNNYKPIDQSFYNDKNVIYNIQSLKPKQDQFQNPTFSDVRSSFSYGKPREQNSFESSIVNIQGLRGSEFVSPSSFIVSTPSDMIGHSSSNIETRQQAPQMEYVPSEIFRQQNQETKTTHQQQQNEQTSSIQISHIDPDGQTSSKYHHIITHPSTDNLQNYYQNSGSHNLNDAGHHNNGRINQNMVSHNLEPGLVNGENNYKFLGNSNNHHQNIGDSFEHQNEIDPNTGSKLTTIHGIKVANPYNVDLKVVSDMLRGKTVVDESRLEPLREQMTRLAPIKLDTSALQEAVSNNEHISLQIDIPDHGESMKNQEFTHLDSISAMRLRGRDPNNNNQKNFKKFSGQDADFQESSRPFQNNFDFKEDHVKYQHNIPNIASEQLQSSVQGVLSTHQIGAVIDQQPGFKARVRSHQEPSGPENQEYSRLSMYENTGPGFMENTFARDQHGSNTVHHPNALISEDSVQKRQKSESEEPYPLLKPPRPPMRARSNLMKKSEKRPFGTRQQRQMTGRHARPIRVMPLHDQDEFEDYEVNYSIQTKLRPPPVNMKKKSG